MRSFKSIVKISISNIIWPKGEENLPDFLTSLPEIGFKGVELALNCFWDEPTTVSKVKLNWLRELLKENNLQVSALHSLTYTREDLELFGSEQKRKELLEYIKRYLDLAAYFECKNIVFGSPKARRKNGKKIEECNHIFLDFLSLLDSFSQGIGINIEPLHVSSCEYLNYFTDVVALLTKSNFKNIKIQLDVRSFIENEEPLELINQYFSDISHCQVSDPGLSIPGTQYQEIHKKVSEYLIRNEYSGFIAGEIINTKNLEKKEYLAAAYTSLSGYYG